MVIFDNCVPTFQFLDSSFQNGHIGLGKAENVSVILSIFSRHFQLFRRHIHAGHVTGSADELREYVDIHARTAAEI